MNAAQISALSQIQAQAIVNARPQTALVGGKTDEKPPPQQIQNQIQLQAQALVHAHTQAQIAAGIYKAGDSTASPASATQETDKPRRYPKRKGTANNKPSESISTNPNPNEHPFESTSSTTETSDQIPKNSTKNVQD